MYVAEVSVRRFRHLENVHLGPFGQPRDSESIVLAGPNGGGKSSILELLAFAFTTSHGYDWQRRRTFEGSSFEVTFGLIEEEIATIRERRDADPGIDPANIFSRLEASRKYIRSFDLPGGEHDADANYHENAHGVVSRCLSGTMKAVFLRSDRHYPQHRYNRNTYWNHANRLTSNYLRTMAFNLTENQYVDQVEYLVEEAYSYPRRVGLHQMAVERGELPGPRPVDPLLAYERILDGLLPGYSFVRSEDDLREQLEIKLPDGTQIAFTDLSSGEQEAFFVLSFLERNGIENSVILVDEPELHLHPELARRLIRLMLASHSGNQVWLATHNAELIDEAGRDRTYLVQREAPGRPGYARPATDEETVSALMRSIFGFAGYVGLAHRMVFLEGDSSSTDRRTFVQMFPSIAAQIRFMPLNSADNALRINRAAMAVLGETALGTTFFLIRDRDYLTDEQVASYNRQAGDRLIVLERHEIENYLLDGDAIREVVDEMVNQQYSVADIDSHMTDACRLLAGGVLRDRVASELAQLFRPVDCSIGAYEGHREWLDNALAWDDAILAAAIDRFQSTIGRHATAITTNTTNAAVEARVRDTAAAIRTSLTDGSWRSLFPGKEVITRLAARYGIGSDLAFTNGLIRNLGAHPQRIPGELRDLMARIVA